MAPPSSELEDAFVNVWVGDRDGDSKNGKDFHSAFVHQCTFRVGLLYLSDGILASAQHSHPGIAR